MEEKIKELSQDQEFCKKLMATESAEEAAALFAAEGVEVTAEELEKIFAGVPSGELGEEELSGVTGGCWDCFWDVVETIKNIWNRHRKK